MASIDYYATYCRFSTEGLKDATLLFGADCPVGDIWSINLPSPDGVSQAQLVNRFGAVVGQLDADMTEQLQVAQVRGWEMHALLASVFLTEKKKDGAYWGEVIVMCFTPNTAFEGFMQTVSKALAGGVRPTVDLGKSGIDEVVATQGAWMPDTRVPPITPPEGSMLLKSEQSINDRLIEQARQGNPGCMMVGWAFTGLLVLGALYLVWKFVLRGVLGV